MAVEPVQRTIEQIAQRLIESYQPRRIPFSPLVLTPDELARRFAAGDAFYQEIVRRGKALAFIQFTEDTWTPAR